MQEQHSATFNNPIEIFPGPPWQTKLFMLYLLMVSFFVVVRALKLTWLLWIFSSRKRAALQKSDNESERANLITAAALANKLSHKDVDTQFSTTFLRQAESRFHYVWEVCSSKVAMIKKIGVLTFLLAALLFVWLTIDLLVLISSTKSSSFVVLAGGMSEILVSFLLGILLCTVLYAISSIYEGVLLRRRVTWNYFCEKIRNKSPEA